MRIIYAVLLASFAFTTNISLAQESTEPQELVTARKTYENQVEVAIRPYKAQYVRQLDTIYNQLVQKGDLVAANAVIAEKQRLTQPVVSAKPIEVAHVDTPLEKTIKIAKKGARDTCGNQEIFSNNIRFYVNDRQISNLGNPAIRQTFELEDIKLTDREFRQAVTFMALIGDQSKDFQNQEFNLVEILKQIKEN